MKKIVIAMMMMIGLVATSYGVVNIDWTGTAGFYFTVDPNIGILGDATGNSTIAQLMYSADGIQDAALTLAGIDTTGAGTGDDVIWGSVLITENGILGDFDEFASFGVQNYQQALVSGSVYAMIFQDNVINGNDWYFYTPMVALTDITGILSPQYIDMNTDVLGNAIDSGAMVGQVVPEPATFLLFGIGGFGAFLLRRRQQA